MRLRVILYGGIKSYKRPIRIRVILLDYLYHVNLLFLKCIRHGKKKQKLLK